MSQQTSDHSAALADYHEGRQTTLMTRSLAVVAGVVFGLNILFVPLDWLAFPEHISLFFATRGALFAVLGIVYFKTRFSHPLPSTFAAVTAMGAMLLTMVWADGGVTSKYSTGLVLLFCGMPVLLPLSVREMVSLVTPILGVYALMPLATGGQTSPIDYALHAFFPLAGAVVAVGSAALMEQIRFRDFLRCRELEQARDHLKEMDSIKARFTANVHHELRTPLTLTLAPIEAFLSGEFGEVTSLQHGYLKSMHTNALRLLKLINNLLDLAKVESHQLVIRREPVHLERIAEELVTGARPLAERKGIQIGVSTGDALPVINVDPDAIEKVLVNLLGNALKFTESGQRIDVALEAHDEGIHLMVSDTGLGIPVDKLERIFDRFAQVDNSNTRRFDGTGIGLSLSKELVDLHQGRIWAESEGEGHGTRMHVTLPVGACDAPPTEQLIEAEGAESLASADSAESAENAESPERPEHRVCSDLSELEHSVARAMFGAPEDETELAAADVPLDAAEVLIVEDNVDMRRLLAHLIGQEFRIRVAHNGRDALEQIRDRLPDLVLTDVMMPEMSGTELCREIKADPATCAIPVVLVTSKAERQMKIQGLEVGAEDYVTKPFHPRELMARVRSLARLHGLQEAVVEQNTLLEQSNADLRTTMIQLKETGAQLAQSERLAAVGELAAGIAHEVNNPINYATNALRTLRVHLRSVERLMNAVAPIHGSAGSELEEQLVGVRKLMDEIEHDELPPQIEELIAIAMDGLDRTERLVHELHHFSVPSNDSHSEVDLRATVKSTLALMQHALRTANIHVRVELPDALPVLTGDPTLINQVLLNILKNASEAMESRGGGTIDIAVRLDGSCVLVEVRDDGPGMSAEVRQRLFEPFFSTKPAGHGAGLGLSICRRILEECGGSIEVNSSPGAGAAFRVRLPIDALPPESVPSPPCL